MATRYFDDADLGSLRRWLEANQDSQSEKMVGEFEAAFGETLGAKHVVACASAMHGLQAALQACYVEPGDEVIVDPIVVFAGLAVMYCNAVPVFADIDPETFNMSPASFKSRITPRTKAVICTHFAGLPCEMDEIVAIARENNIVVIEDCAHALHAEYKGRKAGLLGDMAVFSLNHRKQLSTGQGGVMTFTSEKFYNEVRHLAFGRIPNRLAWNMAIPGIVAALATAQLPKSVEYVHSDREVALKMNQAVEGCPWLTVQKVAPNVRNAYHLWTAYYRGDEHGVDLDAFKRICKEEGADYFLFGFMPLDWHGISARPAYGYPVFTEPLGYGKGCPQRCPHYQGQVDYSEGICPNAEAISPRLINTTPSPITRERGEGLADGLYRAVQRCM